jgi:LysR family glycine cleavage system transcriptional activator
MNRNLPSLNTLRAFEAAARLESFALAANELCVTHGAVSRQIRALEDYFGFDLFDRTHGRVILSDHGRSYLETVSDTFDNLRRATERLKNLNQGRELPRAMLTVHSYRMTSTHWLMPHLAKFQFEHPDLEVRPLIHDDEIPEWETDIDLSVQILPEARDGFQCDRLFGDEIALMCHPALLPKGAMLASPKELESASLLALRRRPDDWPQWFRSAGFETPSSVAYQWVWDVGIMYQWLLEGRGFGLIHPQMAEHLVIEGKLVRANPHVLVRKSAFYLLRPAGQTPPHVTVFRDWLLRQL